ncbi:MAG: transcription-repair coupling factor [Termitinemataceae bacterium]|nr:MAG: transcription-repair coupling factor [Termitinemataceae bacterium]
MIEILNDQKFFNPLCDAYSKNAFPLSIYGAGSSLCAFAIKAVLETFNRQSLIVVGTEKDALALCSDLSVLGVEAAILPCWGTIPYRPLSTFSSVFSKRSRVLSTLVCNKNTVTIASQRAFLTPVPPPEYLKSLAINIKTGEKIDSSELSQKLILLGWTKVQRVQMSGEFVVHGEVIDIFCAPDEAYRILLDFEKIESIKKIDTLHQSSISTVDSFVIHSQKEVVWDDKRIDELSKKTACSDELQEELIAKKCAAGEEYFYPLAFDTQHSILEYVEDGDVFFCEYERLRNAELALEKEYKNLYTLAIREKDVPTPASILLDFDELARQVKRKTLFFTLENEIEKNTGGTSVYFRSQPAPQYMGNIKFLKEDLLRLIAEEYKIIIACETESGTMRMKELLGDFEGGFEGGAEIITAPLSGGFSIKDDFKFCLICEGEIFKNTKRPASLRSAKSRAIDTFVELNSGDYVVHVNYGIGRFLGIDRITAIGRERDYIKLEYANEEIVFIPIEQVNLVQRYIGSEGSAIALDTIGSKSWNERKARARKAAEELAQKLLQIYAKREASVGYTFPRDCQWQAEFEASFPYEETEDQVKCTIEIKEDMEKERPMDRLLCGDVGYGKTEVALRACFKAIMAGKQTAFLVPTTILAQQHYVSFVERFRNFPVRIGLLSRFVDKKEQRSTIEAVQKGEIDILLGTHRIIQKDVKFKDLGLIVIDEEQRFGVKDKEKLKEIKHNVDCLSLSATPIPRTLHMSLVKIRDMSILATPPSARRPIETSVSEYSDEKIADAVRAEIKRGGQVYFLHNRIESLEQVQKRLQNLLPEMIIEIAHGRMEARELEDVMQRFITGGFHVLVATTIIENGIDIPNVNTIIIDRADMYGVSQLYQLRGRVGRSDRTAYAYLFYPRDTAINEVAMKRLSVISDFTELGSGFKVAMKDMEIRGAGNLLGREQSGAIYSVGFDLYMRLLDEAIQRLQKENWEAETEVLLELEYSGFIPDNYIESALEKMDLYKKIAAVHDKDDLEYLKMEMEDRFGPPPLEAVSLLSIAEIKIFCAEFSVQSLKERKGIVEITFTKVAKINVEKLIALMQESGGKIKLNPTLPNVIMLQTGNIDLKEKSTYIHKVLLDLF